MSENTIAKLEKERDRLIEDMRQLSLIDIDRRAQEDRLRDLDAELQRRSTHFNELLTRLKSEQDELPFPGLDSSLETDQNGHPRAGEEVDPAEVESDALLLVTRDGVEE